MIESVPAYFTQRGRYSVFAQIYFCESNDTFLLMNTLLPMCVYYLFIDSLLHILCLIDNDP